jgi:hypothetical protein
VLEWPLSCSELTLSSCFPVQSSAFRLSVESSGCQAVRLFPVSTLKHELGTLSSVNSELHVRSIEKRYCAALSTRWQVEVITAISHYQASGQIPSHIQVSVRVALKPSATVQREMPTGSLPEPVEQHDDCVWLAA